MRRKFRTPKVSTVIGKDTAIVGDLRFSGGLHLDGKVEGNVTGEKEGDSLLTLSESGVITGNVRVNSLVLNGTIIGDVYASERVELASAARVTGAVYYRLLEMSMGAEVNGKLIHADESEPRMLGFDNKEQDAAEKVVDMGEMPQ